MQVRSLSGVVLAAVFTLGTGCVSQRQADDLQTLYRRCQEQVLDLRAQLDASQAQVRALQEAGPVMTQDPQMLSRLESAIAERDRLAQALNEARSALVEASRTPIPLPAELDSELQRLAASNPNLMQYDSRLGMIKFQSDLTFALGSTEVSQEARTALNRFAELMNRGSASGFAARIVGHTDNVRIARPDTLARHPTNWHLSVHRSISVKDVLQSQGLHPARMEVAGHGEYHPIAANSGQGNQANRRVEIYVVPAKPTTNTSARVAPPAPSRPASPQVSDMPNIESRAVPMTPAPTAPSRPAPAPDADGFFK